MVRCRSDEPSKTRRGGDGHTRCTRGNPPGRRSTMTRYSSVAAALAVMLLVSASAQLRAQGGTANKRTFLTFSAPVQVPGTTLLAGTYVFRLANPNAQTIWQVLDGRERRVLSTFYDVPSPRRTTAELNRAGGKPVVIMGETAQG